MPPVTVTAAALADSDGRYGRLAELLGLADADHARAKMEHVWAACTERGEIDLPAWLIAQKLGPRGPDALIAAELGRAARGRGDSDTRRIYICGAVKYTKWLSSNRGQSSNGGKARAQNASRVAGKFTSQVAGGDAGAPTSPSSIAIAIATDPDRTPSESSRAHTRDLTTPDTESTAPAAPRPKRKTTRAPATWNPRQEDELLPPGQLNAELAKFRDWEFAKGKSDWDATWRNWQRTAMERGTRSTSSTNRSTNRSTTAGDLLEWQLRRGRESEAEDKRISDGEIHDSD